MLREIKLCLVLKLLQNSYFAKATFYHPAMQAYKDSEMYAQ
jgi:hypothetical protein